MNNRYKEKMKSIEIELRNRSLFNNIKGFENISYGGTPIIPTQNLIIYYVFVPKYLPHIEYS